MLSLVIYSVLLILKAEAQVIETELVELTANSRSLSYVTTNLSDKFDGEANYTYEDGAELEFSCRKARYPYFILLYFSFGRSDTLRLEYYNAEGTLLFRTNPRNKTGHIFRSLLTTDNNKYYLDCIRAFRRHEYRYRTTFHLMERDYDDGTVDRAMILSVNGQDLPVIPTNNEPTYNDYVFKYIDGEVLLVRCRKSDYYRAGTLTFYYVINNKATLTDRILREYGRQAVRRSSEISVNVSSSFSGKHLICVIDNSDVYKPNARLSLVSDVPENDVRIRGLPRNNILYQYTNDENRWTIEYQYSVNETLDLTCVAKGPITAEEQSLRWQFNGTSSVTSTSLLRTMAMVSNQAFTKTLDATDDAKKISCVYIPHTSPKTVEIILRLKPEENSGEIISTKTQSDANLTDNQHTAGVYSSLVLGSSVGAVLVVLAIGGVVFLCILLMRSRKNRRYIETYGDLTNHNDSPEPQNPDKCDNQYDSCYAENQSEIYYEIPANVGNIDSENHYAEIGNSYCKPKIDGTKSNNTLVYDEPYAHSMRGTLNTFYAG